MSAIGSISASDLSPISLETVTKIDGKSDVSRLDSDKIEKAATDFEGLFATVMLREMQGSLESGNLFGTESGEMFSGLVNMMLGKELAETKSLGIADMVDAYLQSTVKLAK